MAIGSGGAVGCACTGSRGLAASFVAGAVVIFTAGNGVAVSVDAAYTEVTWVQARVTWTAEPITGTLLDEITGRRRGVTRVQLRVAHFARGTVAIVVSRGAVVVRVANAIEALLPDEAVVIGLTKRGTLTGAGGIKRGPGRKVTVFAFRAVIGIGTGQRAGNLLADAVNALSTFTGERVAAGWGGGSSR